MESLVLKDSQCELKGLEPAGGTGSVPEPQGPLQITRINSHTLLQQ